MKRTYGLDEARGVAESLRIDFAKSGFNLAQFRAGLDVEAKHGAVDPATNITNDDPLSTGKIALAHLNELPGYYGRLKKMETDAEPPATPQISSMKPDKSQKWRLATGLLIGLAVLVAGVVSVRFFRKAEHKQHEEDIAEARS